MDVILQPWPWYVVGPIIALCMFLLKYFGNRFGMSGNLDVACSIFGAGRFLDYFKTINWKASIWNLVVVLGMVIGGYVAAQYLTPTEQIKLNPKTMAHLQELGFENPGGKYLPDEIFSVDNILTLKGFLLLLGGGLLIGFGTRYASGCTSGHAIRGLSELQLPSLIAVIGFFIGGLVMTHFLIPVIFK